MSLKNTNKVKYLWTHTLFYTMCLQSLVLEMLHRD